MLVCGRVGSGKSTLLAALSKARPLASGSLAVCESRAYVSQRPFLMRASVRENILFGLEEERERYDDAIRLAALGPDLLQARASSVPALGLPCISPASPLHLACLSPLCFSPCTSPLHPSLARATPAAYLLQLSEGDATGVGEAGGSLSGGQRARVAFARAVYSDAEAIFLDDVLAAVDAHVSRHLWGSLCELRRRGKAVMLVTHELQLLDRPEVHRDHDLHRISARSTDDGGHFSRRSTAPCW